MKGRILIVDDDLSMCEMLETDLRRREFVPTWRTSADDALALFKEQEFDVVLTDLKMPGMDGIEFCQQIIENRSDIPVIVITAFGSLDTAIAAIRAGAYDFVTKPVDTSILEIALKRAVNFRSLLEKIKLSAKLWNKSSNLMI